MKYDEVPFTEKLTDGRERYRLLKSGAVVDNTTGKIVARQLTTSYAREMVDARWDKYRKATASRILKEAQAIDPDIKTEEDAWALLVGKTFIAIMDSDKPRGDDLEKVGKAMGAMPQSHEVKQSLPVEREYPYELFLLVYDLAQKAKNSEVVDGETINTPQELPPEV